MRKERRPVSEKENSRLSFKQLFHLYTQIRIPWVMLILTVGLSILMKQIAVWVVPYQSKIMTGNITGEGFLFGFVGLTFLSSAMEAIQGGVGDLAAQMTARNVRHTIWGKILHLPMSWYDDVEPQSLVSRVTQ